MKNYRIIAALCLALALPACATVERVAAVVTQEFTNPVGEVNIYQVKTVYAAGLAAAVEYRRYCWAKPYADLMADPASRAVCKDRRKIFRAVQSAQAQASAALRAAEGFIRDNPSGTAVTYVRAAWAAVQSFRASVPAVAN